MRRKTPSRRDLTHANIYTVVWNTVVHVCRMQGPMLACYWIRRRSVSLVVVWTSWGLTILKTQYPDTIVVYFGYLFLNALFQINTHCICLATRGQDNLIFNLVWWNEKTSLRRIPP